MTIHLYEYKFAIDQFYMLRPAEVIGLCGWEPESILLVDPDDKVLVAAIEAWFTDNNATYKRIPSTGIFLVLNQTDALVCKLSL